MNKLQIEYGHGIIALPKERVLAGLGGASGFYLKVLLLACADESLCADPEAMCRKLDCTLSALEKALAYWEKAGVFSTVGSQPVQAAAPAVSDQAPSAPKPVQRLQSPSLPSYTENETASIIEKAGELPDIINLCQQIVGKIFTPAETAIVVGLYDHLSLDGEYIATLFAWCKDNGKRSLRYIEKTAISLFDEGIDNTAALTAYIKRKEDYNDNLAKIRKLLGAGARELTAKEKKAFDSWLNEWNFNIDVITRAYEVTVDKISEPSVPYMNRVLENWNKSGLHTLEAVEASLETYRKNKAAAEAAQSGFETDEFFEAALARSYRQTGN
ncbi:MAG: DnaD domain protein [Clostridia bacterium]|nr:DnaD domain protein [Clostridia bacterium]